MLKEPENRVLVFNPTQRLIAVCQSVFAASTIFDTVSRRIRQVCNGKAVTAKGFYFRFLPDDIEVTTQDLGILKLKEYDKLYGVERYIYPTNKLSRKGLKYNTKKKKLQAQKENNNES